MFPLVEDLYNHQRRAGHPIAKDSVDLSSSSNIRRYIDEPLSYFSLLNLNLINCALNIT
jgi:hypothetical protein